MAMQQMRELAEVVQEDGCISFYYQPTPPQNRANKQAGIFLKDLFREKAQNAPAALRSTLEQMETKAAGWNGNGAHAIFACPEKDIWQELELDDELAATQLIINSRFHLKPLTAISEQKAIIALVDKERARFLQLRGKGLRELEQFTDDVPREVRSDGFGGYDAGHIERHVDNAVMRHMKRVAERLRQLLEANEGALVFIACRNELWPDLEPHLHSYVSGKLGGRFTVDPAIASNEEIMEKVLPLLEERQSGETEGLIREALGEAERNGRGATGLKHVLAALERGEVQAVLIGQSFSSRAVECGNCGHLDTRMVDNCAICGQQTREIEDVSDALVTRALRSSAQVQYVDDEALEGVGNVAALLRFRADQNTPAKVG